MKPHGAPGRGILLVSHDRELKRQFRACLSAVGIATGALTSLRSGEECLTALARVRPRLIVLDDSVAALDGPGLLRALHQQAPEVLIIYLTIAHTLDLERVVRQSGVLYYTEKPPDSVLLTKVLASVFAPALGTGWRRTPALSYSVSRR
jgi:two-component system nitrogen regulation response regulator GlnG